MMRRPRRCSSSMNTLLSIQHDGVSADFAAALIALRLLRLGIVDIGDGGGFARKGAGGDDVAVFDTGKQARPRFWHNGVESGAEKTLQGKTLFLCCDAKTTHVGGIETELRRRLMLSAGKRCGNETLAGEFLDSAQTLVIPREIFGFEIEVVCVHADITQKRGGIGAEECLQLRQLIGLSGVRKVWHRADENLVADVVAQPGAVLVAMLFFALGTVGRQHKQVLHAVCLVGH